MSGNTKNILENYKNLEKEKIKKFIEEYFSKSDIEEMGLLMSLTK
jgi:uncharacterized protein (DUF433 family)